MVFNSALMNFIIENTISVRHAATVPGCYPTIFFYAGQASEFYSRLILWQNNLRPDHDVTVVF